MKKRSNETKKIEFPVVDVYSLSGKKVDKFKLDPAIFDAEINKPLLHQVVVMYAKNKRQGTASTKKRKDVSGGGKKPWRQKGTGRARAGSIRSPLWRTGGVVFGPTPRDFTQSLPKKMKRVALRASLSAKTKDKEIIVLERDPELTQFKTKEIAKILTALKTYGKKNLFLYSKRNEYLIHSCRNIENLTLSLCDDFTAYDVLVNSRILFSRDTYDYLVKRLKR
ncbi:50S ribosomal protein L4 [Candidatus Omnitrophota bacterium]